MDLVLQKLGSLPGKIEMHVEFDGEITTAEITRDGEIIADHISAELHSFRLKDALVAMFHQCLLLEAREAEDKNDRQ